MPKQNYSTKKVLVVEDNLGFINLLTILLHEIDIHLIESATDLRSGLEAFRKFQPDLCLLDINLGNGLKDNGVLLAEEIRSTNESIPIIFLTANYTDDYYMLCRHVRPSGFMNKELSRSKLFHTIDMAFLNIPQQNGQVNGNGEAINGSGPEESPQLHYDSKNFFFKIGDQYKGIEKDKIAYFYSKDKLTYAKVGKRNYPTSVQLKSLEEKLFPHFQRVHKSFLVNIDYIASINPKEDKIEVGAETIPIGYAYRKSFLQGVNLLK
ncbi:LytR/AlgR family response regulator transcription factor [Flavilitoribacter nigricans]|nr:LytTR family DNA-binding domain-containing protein [Flavilitoribacter nigricans]